MNLHRFMSVILLVCLIPQFALADRIVLRDGRAVDGTIANREQVELEPLGQESIGILVEGTAGITDLLRFPIGEIEYVVLEDSSGKRVFDVAALEKRGLGSPVLGSDKLRVRASRHRDNGVALFVVGAVCVGVGALIKFGGEKLEVTESSVDYDEKSYNTANYVLMGGGALLAVIGISMIASTPSTAGHYSMFRGGLPGRASLAIGFRF